MKSDLYAKITYFLHVKIHGCTSNFPFLPLPAYRSGRNPPGGTSKKFLFLGPKVAVFGVNQEKELLGFKEICHTPGLLFLR